MGLNGQLNAHQIARFVGARFKGVSTVLTNMYSINI